ncbi:MAG: COX15/CtaA family protein [Alphaproteobacteria bacterium]
MTARPFVRPEYRRRVVLWLGGCAALVVAMIVLGGVTRLTESGLSIVEWRPITGVVPPLGDAAWAEAFAAYQDYPEYRIVNTGMTLAEFKTIYWFEFTHRLLGRAIGLTFLVPLVAFAARRAIGRPLAGRLAVIFVAGGVQGALGWYMVASGLVNRPDVSQYRLAAHLLVAVAIFGAILWTLLDVARGRRTGAGAPTGAVRALWAYLALVAVTIVAGAFVAGTDAGFAYNTFPLMDGRLVPHDLWLLEPWWTNHFENVATVQFQHRVLAILAVVVAALMWLDVWKGRLVARVQHGIGAIFAAAVAQAGLGIATLVLEVPIPLAAAHQAGALVLVTVVVWTLHTARSGTPVAAPGPELA